MNMNLIWGSRCKYWNIYANFLLAMASPQIQVWNITMNEDLASFFHISSYLLFVSILAFCIRSYELINFISRNSVIKGWNV
jgi:hypothetical protein